MRLDYIKIPYKDYENNSIYYANGDYINYLQMENKVIIPTFNNGHDDEVVLQMESIFSGNTIETVLSNELAEDGGILNCITWNIKIDKK